MDMIKDINQMFEREPIENLVAAGGVQALFHRRSGRQWTLCEMNSTSKTCGIEAKLLGGHVDG